MVAIFSFPQGSPKKLGSSEFFLGGFTDEAFAFLVFELGSKRGVQGSTKSVCWEVSLLVVFVLSDCCARDGLHKIGENIVEAMLVLGIFRFFQNKVTAIGGGDHVYFVDSFTFFKWVEETTTYQKGSKGQTNFINSFP